MYNLYGIIPKTAASLPTLIRQSLFSLRMKVSEPHSVKGKSSIYLGDSCLRSAKGYGLWERLWVVLLAFLYCK